MTDKEKQSGTLTGVCFLAFAVLVIAVWGVNRYKNFSSPSSSIAASTQSAAIDLISCMDLQRELNRRDPNLKLDIDGDCGTLTQDAWDKAMGHQYAKELQEMK